MNDLPFIDEARLRSVLGMVEAIDALERGFGGSLPTTPDRSHLNVGNGDLLLMPAWGARSMGVKLVTVAPGNPELGRPLIQGLYVLFEKEGLSPVALFDGAALTALRTAAVSALATRFLASEDVHELVIFGAGTQARSHLEAMVAVRDISSVKIVAPTRSPAEELVDAATALGCEASVGDPAAVAHADLVCTCTTSSRPVFDGALLNSGVHINAVGSYKPEARELDDATIAGARIVVDTPAALFESGDLRDPLADGVIRREDIEELAGVVSAERQRAPESSSSVFKSVGSAFEDLIVAEAVAGRL